MLPDPERWSSSPDSLGGSPENMSLCAETNRTRCNEAILYLVSCTSGKCSTRMPAKFLYTSDWFQKARAYVESTGRPWLILSAKYGLLSPERIIKPYNKTLNEMSKLELCLWSCKVLGDLERHLDGIDLVVILAGESYREFLESGLHDRGFGVCVPMRGLRFGEQLSWLKKHLSRQDTLTGTSRFYDVLECFGELDAAQPRPAEIDG